MNFQDWYTDRMDIFRVEDRPQGNLTKRERVRAAVGVPCRIYHGAKPSIAMKDTAAAVSGVDKLMCGIRVDIRRGDELMVSRGGGEARRYFAGESRDYPEPFGAVLPGLAHKELSISEEEYA